MNEIQVLEPNNYIECILFLFCISTVLCSDLGLEVGCEVVVYRPFMLVPR